MKVNSIVRNFIFLALVLLLAICCSTKQNDFSRIDDYIEQAKNNSLSAQQKDSILQIAYKELQSFPDDTAKVRRIHDISMSYWQLDDFISTKKINNVAFNLAEKINDSLGKARSYFNYAFLYREKQDINKTVENFYKAHRIYENLDKTSTYKPIQYYFKHGMILIELARILRTQKDYIESESLTFKALDRFEKIKKFRYVPICYINLGIIAKYQGRLHESINYNLKSIEASKNKDNFLQHSFSAYNNIGTVYKDLKKFEKAKEFYRKALSLKEFLQKSPISYSRALDNLGYVNFLADINDKTSLKLMNKAYQIRDSINNYSGLSTNSLHLSEYYKAHLKLNSAIKFAKKAVKFSILANDNEELLQAYQLLSEVSEPKTGLEYAQKYIALNDSLIIEERLYRDKFARIRFETDQKEQQIIKVQNQNTVYLLGILLLLSLIGFAMFFFRQRTKYLAQQNKIVQTRAAYETETRISKRLHDELGNDIFQVMLQYQNNPHDPEIVNRLNVTYNKARDISRENSEFEVDETYGEELADMLQNYTNNGVQLILRGLDKLEWDNFSSTVKIAIYRVLQELMTNMQKHSKASLVALIFTYDTKELIIKYSDNGVGFPSEQLTSKNGLRNTEKRIQAIHGTLIFDSEKDKGFKAEIKIPIE